MAFTLTLLNDGADFQEQVKLNKKTPANWTVRLYTNNHMPAVTDHAAAFTECSLSGYGAVATTPASWTGSTAGGVADYTYPAITFTFSAYVGGTTIYGVFIAPGDGTCWLAGLLDTPYAVPAGGGSLTVSLEDKQQQCS